MNHNNHLNFIVDSTLTEEYPDLSDYHLIKTLGAGSFGKVILGTHKIKGLEYAIKVIKFIIILHFMLVSSS